MRPLHAQTACGPIGVTRMVQRGGPVAARACPERRSCRPWGSRRGVGEGDVVATSQRCTCMRDSLEVHAAPRRLVNDSRPACGLRKGSFRAKRGPWPMGEIM